MNRLDKHPNKQPRHPTQRLARAEAGGSFETRDFGLLWWGQVTSQIGEGLNKVALLWFVYELTGSAMMIATVGLLQTVPPLFFGPLIGVYLDRLRKKPVMIWVDLIRTVLTFLIPALYGFGLLKLEGLFILIFLQSMVSTVFGPALVSAVPSFVRRSELVSANALIQGTNNIGLLLGPAVSGVLIALIGAQYVLYVNAATFFISALCLMPIRSNETLRQEPKTAAETKSLLSDLSVGFRFVFSDRSTVFGLVTISALYNLGASAFVFVLPVYAKESLQVGPVELGWLWSALGAGMLRSVLMAGPETAERCSEPHASPRQGDDRGRVGGVRPERAGVSDDRGGICAAGGGGRRRAQSGGVGTAAGGHAVAPDGPCAHDVQHRVDGGRDGGHVRIRLDCG